MVIVSLKRSNYTLCNSLLQKTEKKFENLSNFSISVLTLSKELIASVNLFAFNISLILH